jgi:SpoVK/Ycf46/Vps4 family AAA+-type ATPase
LKLLTDFLSTERDISKSDLAKLLGVSRPQLLILKFLTKKYLEDIEQFSVGDLLNSVFRVKAVEKKARYVDDIRELYRRGLITINISGFFPMELTKQSINSENPLPALQILSSSLSLHTPFLHLLETGKFHNRDIPIDPYKNSFEYIEDQIKRVSIYIERAEGRLFGDFQQQLDELNEAIEFRYDESDIEIPLHDILNNRELSEKEQIIFLAILGEEYSVNESVNSYRNVNTLLQLISDHQFDKIENRSLFDEDSKLSKEGLIEFETIMHIIGENKSVSSEEVYIVDEILQQIEEKSSRKKRKDSLQKVVDKQTLFELVKPKDSLQDVVLSGDTKEILQRITKQLNRKVISRLVKWGIKEKGSGISARIIFHGSPGTGKTMTAVALAKSLKRDVLHFDCSKILSMYVGESEKNVRNIFDTYKKIVEESGKEPLLLLNEADQFLTSRSSDLSSSTTQMYNQMQNIFLEQIENFSGVLVATTNLLQNIDKAFSRRFNYKVEFKLPNRAERVKIWEKHLPKNADFEEGFKVDDLAKYELSGGQIDLIVKNSSYEVATRDEPLFTVAEFEKEIQRELGSRFDKDRVMGFLKK